MQPQSSAAALLTIALCSCGYDGPDAEWCDPSEESPPIVSFAVVAVFDADGNPYCPASDAMVRTVQGADRNYTLVRRPGFRAERGSDGRIVSFSDPAGCNQYSSGETYAYCRPATLTAEVDIPGCGAFDETIGWLENYGMGENGISWVVGVDVECAAP